MAQLNLSKESYTFKMQEGKMLLVAGKNEGGIANNAKVTMDGMWNMTNFLKTHEDQRTPENVGLLSECVQTVEKQAQTDKHIPGDLLTKIKKTKEEVKKLK